MKQNLRQIDISRYLEFETLDTLVSSVSHYFQIIPENVMFDYELFEEIQKDYESEFTYFEKLEFNVLGNIYAVEIFAPESSASKDDYYAFVYPM